MQRSLGLIGKIAFWLIVLAQTSETARAASEGISREEGIRLVAMAMAPYRLAIGRFLIQTFDDPPRLASDATLSAPIAIRIGDSRIEPVSGIYDNCRADSSVRTVRCDLRFLDELIDGLSLIYSENQRTELRIRLLQLVLAHELGHIFYHDVSGAYHGDQDGFSVIRYASYKVELRADAYAIRLIDSYAQNRELIYGDIVELASNSVRRSLCPQTFPAPCACAGYSDATLCSRVPLGPGLPISPDDRVPVKLVGTHPDYVVRFSRMLFLSKDPVARIYRNQAREVLRRVVVVNEAGQSESVDALLNTSQASPDVH